MQSWIFLAGAIVLGVAGTSSMKLSEGFSKFAPSVFIFVFYGLSFVSLTFAIKEIDISIGYAVWPGIGTALIAAIGFLYFKEPLCYCLLHSKKVPNTGQRILSFSLMSCMKSIKRIYSLKGSLILAILAF